jgi:hypothetical protein
MKSSVDEYIARLEPAQATLVKAICEVVRQAAPDARESIKWAQPVWEVNGPVCSVKAFRSATNVNFWRGAELAATDDPERLLLGEGGKMRHIRLTSIDDLRAAAVQRLVQAAVERNRQFGDPTRPAVASLRTPALGPADA